MSRQIVKEPPFGTCQRCAKERVRLYPVLGALECFECSEQAARPPDAIEKLGREAVEELRSAMELHGPMASAHEGYSVILEELDELWDEIKKKRVQRSVQRMRAEAIQVAAMALRFVRDLCEESRK